MLAHSPQWSVPKISPASPPSQALRPPTPNAHAALSAGKMPGTRGPVPVPLRDGDRDVTQQILDMLDEKPELNSSSDFPQLPQAEIKAALDRLASRSMIEYKTEDREVVVLTKEGQSICDEGSHEFKVWAAVSGKGKIAVKELAVRTSLLRFAGDGGSWQEYGTNGVRRMKSARPQ